MNAHPILQKCLKGERLSDVFIIDVHAHLDFWKDSFQFKTDIESIIADMDRIGIDVICLNKWNCPDIKSANEDVAKAMKKYPNRVIGFAAIAFSLGLESTRKELERCFDKLGFKGIKVHEGYDKLYLRDQVDLPEYKRAIESVWEFAAERKCPVLCHGLLTPEVAKSYPEAIFILAHAGGSRAEAWKYVDCKNVYFDTASSFTLRGNIEYLVKVVGVERILLGTDQPHANPAYRLGQVVSARLSDEQMRKILGENAAKILNIRWREK